MCRLTATWFQLKPSPQIPHSLIRDFKNLVTRISTSISEYFRTKQQMCTFEAPDVAHIFDVVTKIFRAQIFTTTTTTKAKLILNKLSEVHTYWRFNEHTYSDFIIKNIQLFDDNINLMHLWNDAFQIICMRSHMHDYSHVLRVLWMAASWVHDSVEHQQSSVVVVPSSFDACSTAVSSGSGLLRLPRPTGFMMLFWSSSGHTLPRHPGQIHGFKSASQKNLPGEDWSDIH